MYICSSLYWNNYSGVKLIAIVYTGIFLTFFGQDGYFGLTSQHPGCTACNCDMAGSVNKSCSSTGQCFCRPRFSGLKCDVIEPNFFLPSVDFMTFQAEDAFAVSVSTNVYISIFLV